MLVSYNILYPVFEFVESSPQKYQIVRRPKQWQAYCINYAKILSMSRNNQENDQSRRSVNASENEKGNVEKNPDDWVTGDEPMTGAQKSYLNTLASEAGEEPVDNLTKAEASKKIEELQQKTGRGLKDKS
jgi:hypothetical protein